jgi:hypothetical protein
MSEPMIDGEPLSVCTTQVLKDTSAALVRGSEGWLAIQRELWTRAGWPPTPYERAKAAHPQSLTQERYVAAWHVKRSLR